MILDIYKERNTVIDWIQFVQAGLEHLWRYRTIVSKIEVSLLEVYGKEYSEHVVITLHDVFQKYKDY